MIFSIHFLKVLQGHHHQSMLLMGYLGLRRFSKFDEGDNWGVTILNVISYFSYYSLLYFLLLLYVINSYLIHNDSIVRSTQESIYQR